jgi:two-component system sensor histidine kinase BaeS
MLALLGLTLVVLIATLGLARWSFERGFLDYVNALEQTRLTAISETIGRTYVDNGSTWQGVDLRLLNRQINRLPEGRPPPHMRPNRPPPGMNPDHLGKRPPPPPFDDDFERATEKRGPLKKLKARGTPPTALFDLEGNNLAGTNFSNSERESIDVFVMVDGQPVALLKSEPKRRFDSSIETAFSRQQWITSGIIGIASLLLAALVSWGLVRLFLSPVRRIIEGVNRLSKGDYSQQLRHVENRHDEFGQLMDDLNHLTRTLDKNQSSRRRWIADISHELRTPLSVLTGEVEALKDGIRPFNQEQLQSLDQEIKRLRHLTDDLYELSLSDAGGLRYEFKEVDLANSINQIVKSHELSADEQGISISIRGEKQVMISADAKRINQLLSNLIRNSLAYTDFPGRLDFDLQLKKDHAYLSVSDTPPGVTKEECLHLFEPLYRQDTSRTRRGAGAGLGLAICQNIVEAHRGRMMAKPSQEGGLQIDIELPLSKQESA